MVCIVADHTTVMFDPKVSGSFPLLPCAPILFGRV